MDNSEAKIEERRSAVSSGVAGLTQIVIDRARGAEVWDVNGRRYLDFAGGIGVLNVGHCHPKVVAAIQSQAERLIHSSYYIATYEGYSALCQKLNKLAPGDQTKKSALFNSGAEALENVVKIARYATGRTAIISFESAFHGRTLLTMTLSGKTAVYKVGFGPYASDVYHAPFPNGYRRPRNRSEEEWAQDCLDALKRMFRTQVRARDVACILVEVIQGEAGFIPGHPLFLNGVQEICRQEAIFLAVDEVQSGVGRTGKFFAFEHYGLEPDLIAFAKSIAAGMPLSGVIGRADTMDRMEPGAIGGTYTGNPVACAAALAVLDVITEEDLLTRSARLGDSARTRLLELQRNYEVIGDVRGIGSMLAIELVTDRNTKEPATELTKRVAKTCEEHGLIVATAGDYMNVIRLLYPLVIPEEQLKEGLDILDAALGKTTRT